MEYEIIKDYFKHNNLDIKSIDNFELQEIEQETIKVIEEIIRDNINLIYEDIKETIKCMGIKINKINERSW